MVVRRIGKRTRISDEVIDIDGSAKTLYANSTEIQNKAKELSSLSEKLNNQIHIFKF